MLGLGLHPSAREAHHFGRQSPREIDGDRVPSRQAGSQGLGQAGRRMVVNLRRLSHCHEWTLSRLSRLALTVSRDRTDALIQIKSDDIASFSSSLDQIKIRLSI
jgi:hypothetical protein